MTEAIAVDMLVALRGLQLLWWLATPSVCSRSWSRHCAPPRVARVVARHALAAVPSSRARWSGRGTCAGSATTRSSRSATRDNLVRGHGLVFNVGERVEGYTNFLWTVLLCRHRRARARHPADVAGAECALVRGACSCSARVCRRRPIAKRPRLPRAARRDCCAQRSTRWPRSRPRASRPCSPRCWPCIALERGLRRRAGSPRACRRRRGDDASRPRHLVRRARRCRCCSTAAARRAARALRAAVRGDLLALLRRGADAYYGDLFPNTYYAKSANLTYFSARRGLPATFLIGGGLLGRAARARLWRVERAQRGCSHATACIGVPLFCVYIAKIGGDFMFGRLFCPIVAAAAGRRRARRWRACSPAAAHAAGRRCCLDRDRGAGAHHRAVREGVGDADERTVLRARCRSFRSARQHRVLPLGAGAKRHFPANARRRGSRCIRPA